MFRFLYTTFLLILFLSIISPKLYSQFVSRSERLTMDDGLSGNTIYNIIQDSKGFMWFATLGGLNRYDGYEIKAYTHNPDDDRSISNAIVNSIYEDRSGNLWIGTFYGLNKFNTETDDFTVYLNDPNDENSISSNVVMGIYEDQDSVLWIGTDGGGLNKFDRKTQKFKRYTHDPDNPKSISFNSIYYGIVETKSGDFWIGTYGGGLDKFNKEAEFFTHYTHDPNNAKSLSNNRIFTLCEDRMGTLWIGTDGGGLNKLIPNEIETEPPAFICLSRNPTNPKSLIRNRVFSIIEDNSGEIWIGLYDGGVIRFDPLSNQIVSDITYATRSVYQDPSGLIWYGTEFGVFKLNKSKLAVKHFKNDPSDPKSFSGVSVISIVEYNPNIIWIASQGGGLNKFIRDKEEFISYKKIPKTNISLNWDLSWNNIVSLAIDQDSVLWIGTRNGLKKLLPDEMNKRDPNFIHYLHNPSDPTSLCGNVVTTVMADIDGNIWIGAEGKGISKLPASEKNKLKPVFINYEHNSNDPTSLIDNTVWCIYEDSKKDIWFATLKGLDKFDKKREQFIHYNHIPKDINSLSSNGAISILEDRNGNLWIGTLSGLNKFDRETERFRRYTRKDGLADDSFIGLLVEDDYGNLWMCSNSGISMLNPKTEKFKNFDQSDGFQREFVSNSCCKSSSGELFIGGTDGFHVFHPDDLKKNTHLPPIVITDFHIDNLVVPVGFDSTKGRTILETAIEQTKEIELLHTDNVISFQFSALDYYTPEKNQYAYMMEGFDENWKYTDASRRYVTYTNLDPGNYIFRVKGSNDDGYWNEAGASLSIIILPPWWATTWAYIVYTVLIVSGIYFTWRMQLRRIHIKHDYEMSKFEAEKMHEVDDMKSKFFANISHEFRTPLTLILGPVKQIIESIKDDKTKNELKIVHRNARRLHGLVNQLLDLSKLESGKMKLETELQNIIPVLKGLVLSFASYAERQRITLNFNSEKDEILVFIEKDKVEKIITNLLSNALKFTPEGGTVSVNVSQPTPMSPLGRGIKGVGILGEVVEINVSDNGIGIAKERLEKIFDRFYQVDGSHTREQEGTGLGLALTKELVELHKGKIKVESEEGKGSTFTVTLLLGKKHLKPEEIFEQELVEEEDSIAHPLIESQTFDKEIKADKDISPESVESLLLIVEDNSDVRHYIRSNIEEDYRIIEAVDGEDGFSQAIETIPDLIISDVMMPKMDGFEMCKKIKTDERTCHIPIILLTAKATSKDKIDGYETGADDYIMKPFNTEELKARIKSLIEIRRKLQEKFSKEDFRVPGELKRIDKEFLDKILKIIDEHISEEEFSIEELGKESAMSRGQIYKKIKALTGKSPSLFLRSIRLTKAKRMIKDGAGTIAEIAYLVGFSSPAYFTKCFSEEFGYHPSDIANKS